VLHLRQNAEQILHMMTDFMRDHVGLGEFACFSAAAAEARLDVAEERGIEINAPVVRTVERSHGCLRHAAATLHDTRIQSQPRHSILLAVLLENFLPGIFCVAENGSDKIAHLVGRLACRLPRLRLVGLLLVSAAVHNLSPADQNARVDTERPADQSENDDGSDPHAAAADRDAHTAAADAAATFLTARILDIVAAAKIIPTHDGSSEDLSQ